MKRTTSSMKRLFLAAASAAGLGALSAPAIAQDETAEDQDEIIVSARRRAETLQDTPVAMTALATQQIESKGAVNLGDLQGAAPNLLITQQNSGPAAANLSIRGLTFADIEKSFDPTVSVVVDGVFVGTSTGQYLDFFDIQQIEVLRGPQGTLFGRNTIGGVINIIRTKPTHEWGAKAEVAYGSFDTVATRAVVNMPLAGGEVGIKGFYFHNQNDGYHRYGGPTNTTLGRVAGERVGGVNTENFGVAVSVTPEGSIFDGLLTLEKQVQDFEPVNSNISQTGELFCLFEPADQCDRNTTEDLYTVFNDPAHSHYTSPAATLEMNLDLGGPKLTSVTGWRKSDEDHTQDFDSSTTDLYYTRRVQNFQQFSQELRLAGDLTNWLDYVVGFYHFASEYTLVQDTRLFGAPLGAPQIVSGNARSTAFFGDFNVKFSEQVRLNAGGRWTQDKKSIDNMFFVDLGAYESKFDKFTPKVSLDFRPNDDHLLYASWSRGYRSGGFSNRAQTLISTATPFGPETVDSYEIGAKSSFYDGMLKVNIAAFYSDYKDLQQNTTISGGPTGNETIVFNVGSAKVKGIELDFTATPTDRITFSGTLGVLDSEFKDFITTAPSAVPGVLDTYDYSAVDMIYSPDFSGSLNATYDQPTSFGSVVANVGYRYIGRYDQQISIGPTTAAPGGFVVLANDPRVRTDKQALLDASLTANFEISGAAANLTVYGRNLLDDRGTSAAFTVADNPTNTGLWAFASAREPRAWGVKLGVDF